MGVIFFLLSLASSSFARTISYPVFEFARQDRLIPAHCADMTVDRFAHLRQILTIGSKGATQFGYDLELPLTRDEAQAIGTLLKNSGNLSEFHFNKVWAKLSEPARDAYTRAMREGAQRGFELRSGGAFLEFLAMEQLSLFYPEYVVGGGLNYRTQDHQSLKRQRHLGELDLVIIDPQDCSVIGIAEVKMGLGEVRSALKQLKTFGAFLLEHRRHMQAQESSFEEIFAQLDPSDDAFCAQMLGEAH